MSLAEATAQHRAGDRATAERLYRRALIAQPKDPATLHGFGVLCHETGRDQEALTNLPTTEREAWRKFWADVDAQQKRSAPPPK